MRAFVALVVVFLVAFGPTSVSASEPSFCAVGPYEGATILRAGCIFDCVEGQTIVAIGVGGVAYVIAGHGAGVVVAECGGAVASCVAVASAGGDSCGDTMSPTLGRGTGACEGVGAGLDRFACCALPSSEDAIETCKALVGW